MPRFSAPIISLASLVIVGLVATGCGGGTAAASPAAAAAPAKPTMQLTLSGGAGAGTYSIDKTSSLNSCTKGTDGSWRLLYAGGSPFVNLDLLVGPHAAQSANEVAAEINAGTGYMRFDPAQMRGGDRKGRSEATVAVSSTAAATTFTVKAKTPDIASNETVTMDVDLTVTCPNPA